MQLKATQINFTLWAWFLGLSVCTAVVFWIACAYQSEEEDKFHLPTGIIAIIFSICFIVGLFNVIHKHYELKYYIPLTVSAELDRYIEENPSTFLSSQGLLDKGEKTIDEVLSVITSTTEALKNASNLIPKKE